MFNIVVKLSSLEKDFLYCVRKAMEAYFGEDKKRIDHALQVSCFVEELLAYIDADPVVTLCAAYLHDIGIHEAERKHRSNSGKWQEIEGPPIAEDLLRTLGAEDALINQVIEIIANHHTRDAVHSPEFRILWDSDALVNFAESLPSKPQQKIIQVLQSHMMTEPGFRLAKRIFIRGGDHHSACLKGHRPAFLP
jgi:hypothetical protein